MVSYLMVLQDRAFALHNLGVTIYHEDLCHTEFLEDIFVKYNFTHVTHLAAQAGVRYSLENPLAYIRANVECQVALLEVLRKYPVSRTTQRFLLVNHAWICKFFLLKSVFFTLNFYLHS